MRRIHSLFLILILLLPGRSHACINEYYRTDLPLATKGRLDLYGLLNRKGDLHPYWKHGFGEYMPSADSREDSQSPKPAYKVASDLAAHQLRTHQIADAVKLLEQLYAQHPNEYNIVANLGTAYELTGENAKALALLRKAAAMNPGAHQGSEWIHVKILEQKTSSLPYKSIINLGVQDFSQWIIDKQYVFPRPADILAIQIAYQLHERIAFIAAPDSIIGQLVLDFADIIAKGDARDSSIAFYDYAARYAPTLQATVRARKEVLKAEQKEVQRTFGYASIVWAIPLLAFFLILLAWWRTMRRQKSEAGGQK